MNKTHLCVRLSPPPLYGIDLCMRRFRAVLFHQNLRYFSSIFHQTIKCIAFVVLTFLNCFNWINRQILLTEISILRDDWTPWEQIAVEREIIVEKWTNIWSKLSIFRTFTLFLWLSKYLCMRDLATVRCFVMFFFREKKNRFGTVVKFEKNPRGIQTPMWIISVKCSNLNNYS